MRVRVREAHRLYWNYRLIDLAAGDEETGDLAAYLLSTGSPVDLVDDEPDSGELDVDGTVADVLAWVGEDPQRAEQALAAESAKDKPRATLLAALAKLGES